MRFQKNCEIPKFDAHMHIWNIEEKNNPWLMDSGVIEFRYGDYKSIRKNYLLTDYLRDFHKHNFIGSAFVETEWHKGDAEGELQFVVRNNADNFIRAVLAQGWLDMDFDSQLKILKRYPLVRGIRQKPRIVARRDYLIGAKYSGTMISEAFLQGLSLLDKEGLIFEVQTAWWHLAELVRVKSLFPSLKIVVNHAGMPETRDEKTLKEWGKALGTISTLPDVYIKLSGFGEYQLWNYDRNRVIFQTITNLFDSRKILFATNFPVDKVVTTADCLMEGFYQGLSHLGINELENIFYKNAVQLYGVDCKDLYI